MPYSTNRGCFQIVLACWFLALSFVVPPAWGQGGDQGTVTVTVFDQSGAVMMTVPAGSFSLHHTLCRHRSAPNRADHRRVGYGDCAERWAHPQSGHDPRHV